MHDAGTRAGGRAGARRARDRFGPAGWDGRPEPLYWVVIRVLDLVVRLLFRLRLIGGEHLPRRGPALLAANHVSFLDPVVLAVAAHRLGRRVRFFAHEGLFRKPVLGWLLRESRQIPVYRGLGTARATERVREALDAGELVVVYPEGTIPPPGECPPARPGAGLVAATCNVDVLPVALWGMQRRGGGYHLRLRRAAAVVVNPPLDLDVVRTQGALSHQETSELILAAVRALLPKAQRLTGGTGS